ncbi:MAG TPA: hypothetical protein VNM67_02190 [Thermoanaerobaculia bacterium]|nr:hypothetical protein [Thermoanaerobaculia bacterium]
MSENLRYLITMDSKSGKLLKAEQIGEAGDLGEVDLAAFVRSLTSSLRVHGDLGAPSQVVINVYSGGAQVESGKAKSKAPQQDPPGTAGWDGPPPPPPPPHKPPKGRK